MRNLLLFISMVGLGFGSSYAQTNNNTLIDDVEIPETMMYPVDSLLSAWMTKNYLSEEEDCEMRDENPYFSDSVYMDRLSRIPAIIEMPYNEVVRKFIDLYTTKLRKQVSIMLGASNFYMPIFEEALDAYNLPLELKYLPIIESSLNPKATSRAGASGLWQFMINTGKIYGLESNSLIDERRDPIKATWAAARYLRDLYNIYQDWNLVIAAYNCGPGNINKAIRRSGGSTDYWAIYNNLPKETRGYVPAFIAANYVMHYYCDHNICPLDATLPANTDTLHIDRKLHFAQIADLCDIEIDQIRNLNPQYKQDVVPGDAKSAPLRLPQNLVSTFIEYQDTIYAHRQNELFTNRRTVAVTQPATTAKRTTTSTAAPPSGDVTYHKIQSGETLSTIATKYKVTVKQIQQWNNLSSTRINAGKNLKIYR
ncbi:MAG: transglycosylase SLT domain-containing protein [Bacteroides sp.]|nr:transglycosylase SLT domain-containing protein [Bacteroides sp.]